MLPRSRSQSSEVSKDVKQCTNLIVQISQRLLGHGKARTASTVTDQPAVDLRSVPPAQDSVPDSKENPNRSGAIEIKPNEPSATKEAPVGPASPSTQDGTIVAEQAVAGEFGSFVLSVRVFGTTTLTSDTAAVVFRRALECVSQKTIQTLLDSMEIFFLSTRSPHTLYVMNSKTIRQRFGTNAPYGVLSFLAACVNSPNCRMVTYNARLLFQLLFQVFGSKSWTLAHRRLDTAGAAPSTVQESEVSVEDIGVQAFLYSTLEDGSGKRARDSELASTATRASPLSEFELLFRRYFPDALSLHTPVFRKGGAAGTHDAEVPYQSIEWIRDELTKMKLLYEKFDSALQRNALKGVLHRELKSGYIAELLTHHGVVVDVPFLNAMRSTFSESRTQVLHSVVKAIRSWNTDCAVPKSGSDVLASGDEAEDPLEQPRWLAQEIFRAGLAGKHPEGDQLERDWCTANGRSMHTLIDWLTKAKTAVEASADRTPSLPELNEEAAKRTEVCHTLASLLTRGQQLKWEMGRVDQIHDTLRCHGTVVHPVENSPHPSTPASVEHRRTSWFKVHPSYVTLTATGRIFSRGPNLQTLPVGGTQAQSASPVRDDDGGSTATAKEYGSIRNCFVAPKGSLLVSFDYSQIELRVLASISGDPKLIEVFSTSTDGDVLASVAATVFSIDSVSKVTPQQRQAMKVVVYGLIYGMGDEALNRQLRQAAQKTAQESSQPVLDATTLRKTFFDCFPGVEHFLSLAVDSGKYYGKASTLAGRPRRLSKEADPRSVERQCVSTIIQGTAAEILRHALWRLHQHCRERADDGIALLLPIHDEIILSVRMDYQAPSPSSLDQGLVDLGRSGSKLGPIKDLLEDRSQLPFPLAVPLKVSVRVGHRWGSLKPLPNSLPPAS